MDRVGKQRLKLLGMTYPEYLRSPHWRGFCKTYWAASGLDRGCFVCGRKSNIQFHHLTYERLGRELPGDVMPLCASHHRRLHNIQKSRRKKYLLWDEVKTVLLALSPRRKRKAS